MSEQNKPLPVEPLVYHRETDTSRILVLLGYVGIVVGINRIVSGVVQLWFYGYLGPTPLGRATFSYFTNYAFFDSVGLIIIGGSLSVASIGCSGAHSGRS
jgi:hypothetical protein